MSGPSGRRCVKRRPPCLDQFCSGLEPSRTVSEVESDPRYRPQSCRRIWCHDLKIAAPARSKLLRDAVTLAVKSVIAWLLRARIAANPSVARNTEAILIVNEHVRRHTRFGARGFQNLTHYIARCLFDAGGFRALTHSLLLGGATKQRCYEPRSASASASARSRT